jgi:hypothetical protein
MPNSWGTLTFDVPDFLEDTRDAINSIAEFLVTVLDIALLALNFVKTFLVGFLDPIAAIVQALVDELNNMLRDIRQLGVYMTGDWKLLSDPKELQGGFQEYERRMIARLTDRTDPTRPDVSPSTSVLSLFFYTSVDLSDWFRLVQTVLQLLAYFKQVPSLASGLPTPVITQVLYGSSASDTIQFGDLGKFFTLEHTPPPLALVKWQIDPGMRDQPFMPNLSLPPGGFVVTVSTLPEGIPIVYDRPQGSQTKQDVPGQTAKAQPREYGQVRLSSGQPFVLYGGAEMLDTIPPEMTYNGGVSDGAIKDGATRVYGTLGQSKQPVPIDLLSDGGTYFFQRTFYVSPVSTGFAWMTGDYSILLDGVTMPHAAHVETNDDGTLRIVDDGPASTIYVRVATCSRSVSKAGEFRYQFRPEFKAMTGPPLEVGASSSPTDIGDFSQARQVVFANANTEKYLEALKTALLVLVLSRPDLKPVDLLEGTVSSQALEQIRNNTLIVDGVALQACGLEGVQHLTDIVYNTRSGYSAAMKEFESSPLTFRRDLLKRIELAAHDIYSKTGPMPEVEQFVVQQTSFLRSVTWLDILGEVHPQAAALTSQDLLKKKLLESLSDKTMLRGLARNPLCAAGNEDVGRNLMQDVDRTQDRSPHMQEGMLDRSDTRWSSHLTFSVTAEEASAFLVSCPPGLRKFYMKCRTAEGALEVPETYRPVLEAAAEQGRMVGSADLSPVFYFGTQFGDPTKLYYCRGLFAQLQNGRLFREASIALRTAGAAIRRSPKDGEWLYFRWFDSFPGLEDTLAMVANWAESLQSSMESIVDTIRKYIEFMEARIVEVQQLIRRINSVLQSILGFAFQIPKCSAILMLSQGTGGVLADLVSADNKPADSPLAYGGGVAMLIPLLPSFLFLDLILAIMKYVDEDPKPNTFMAPDPATVDGIDGIPEIPPSDPIPDVL